MIHGIHLANVGAYDSDGTKFEDLKEFNFIFGSNGSGKTTVSRLIDGSIEDVSCILVWENNQPLKTSVYNKNFVEKHFDSEEIRGIYTFGENVDAIKTIEKLKIDEKDKQNIIKELKKNLYGDNLLWGKKVDRDLLEQEFENYIWSEKKKFEFLKERFKGFNNNKRNFYEKYISECSKNNAILRSISDLSEDAEKIFSSALLKEEPLECPDNSDILELEKSKILSEVIIGKQDVNIADLIDKIGNIDWVQEGRRYFNKLNDQCPFCQQKTDSDFKQILEAYFDDKYNRDIDSVDDILSNYQSQADILMDLYALKNISDSTYIDKIAFEKDIAALRNALKKNIQRITAKRKEPSVPKSLDHTESLFATLNAHLRAANKKIEVNNGTVDNIDAHKAELTSQIWRRLLEDTMVEYNKYKIKYKELSDEIESLEENIKIEESELISINNQIENEEKKLPAFD